MPPAFNFFLAAVRKEDKNGIIYENIARGNSAGITRYPVFSTKFTWRSPEKIKLVYHITGTLSDGIGEEEIFQWAPPELEDELPKTIGDNFFKKQGLPWLREVYHYDAQSSLNIPSGCAVYRDETSPSRSISVDPVMCDVVSVNGCFLPVPKEGGL